MEGLVWSVIWTAFNMHVESLKSFKESEVMGFPFLKNHSDCGIKKNEILEIVAVRGVK